MRQYISVVNIEQLFFYKKLFFDILNQNPKNEKIDE